NLNIAALLEWQRLSSSRSRFALCSRRLEPARATNAQAKACGYESEWYQAASQPRFAAQRSSEDYNPFRGVAVSDISFLPRRTVRVTGAPGLAKPAAWKASATLSVQRPSSV